MAESTSLRKKNSAEEPSVSGTPPDAVQDKNALIYAKLKQIYRSAVLPVEKRYRYDYFYESPFMSDVEFDGKGQDNSEVSAYLKLKSRHSLLSLIAKPQVLLIGQYSVGKTSFIRYLLGRDFPGQRIGPEPTTDRFTGTFNINQ